MDNILKAAILNSGISFNAIASFFYILDNTHFNEDDGPRLSDTPYKVGDIIKAQPGAVVDFASKNLR